MLRLGGQKVKSCKAKVSLSLSFNLFFVFWHVMVLAQRWTRALRLGGENGGGCGLITVCSE